VYWPAIAAAFALLIVDLFDDGAIWNIGVVVLIVMQWSSDQSTEPRLVLPAREAVQHSLPLVACAGIVAGQPQNRGSVLALAVARERAQAQDEVRRGRAEPGRRGGACASCRRW
jgi:hypothetical protein